MFSVGAPQFCFARSSKSTYIAVPVLLTWNMHLLFFMFQLNQPFPVNMPSRGTARNNHFILGYSNMKLPCRFWEDSLHG